MAKRRSEVGKKGKHGGERIEVSREKQRRKRGKQVTVMVIAVILVAAAFSTYYFLYRGEDEPDEIEEISLSTQDSHGEGKPNEDITFQFEINNPAEEEDVFSPFIYGLPSDWDISTPVTISVPPGSSQGEEFSIRPSPTSALNKTYDFLLNVTSANTQQTDSLSYSVTIHAIYGLELICYNNTHHADPERSTYYGLLIENTGNSLETFNMSHNESHLPHNWEISFDYETIEIPAFSSRVVIINITTYSNSSKGRYDIDIIVSSQSGNSATLPVNTSLILDFVSETIEYGDTVQTNYIGYFIDGVIFDTSYFEIANNSDYPKDDGFMIRDSYEPLKTAISTEDIGDYISVIEGYREGLIGVKANETVVVRVPSEKGYRDGLTRIFEITVVSIDG